jgi:uncharacterized RDD family membrane protein YckC
MSTAKARDDSRPARRSIRARRAVAAIIDGTPTFAVWLALWPALLVSPLLAYESAMGVGLYDPAVGGDPVLVITASRALAPLPVLLAAFGLWWLSQAVAALVKQATFGKLLTQLRIADEPLARARPLHMLVRALLPTTVFMVFLTLATALSAGGEVLGACNVLAAALVATTVLGVVNAGLVLASGASFYDRITGTCVRPRG